MTLNKQSKQLRLAEAHSELRRAKVANNNGRSTAALWHLVRVFNRLIEAGDSNER